MTKKLLIILLVVVVAGCVTLGFFYWQTRVELLNQTKQVGDLLKQIDTLEKQIEELEKQTKEVTITTDKTEYEQAEIVKIIFSNDAEQEFRQVLSYSIEKFDNEKWRKIFHFDDYCNCGAKCLRETRETIIPAYSFKEFQWDQNMWICNIPKLQMTSQGIIPGRYRVKGIYFPIKDVNNKTIIYSDEFTIKEKEEKRTFPHGLIVASQNGLVKLRYNPSKQAYEKQAELTLSEINDVVLLDDYIFVSTKDEILKLTTKLEKSISKKFGTIGALAADNKNIFISAKESFIALDKNLEELSRVELVGFNSWKKNAHDILIYKNTAYLLDNIMTPLFLFRVNIENPKNIQIDEKIEFQAINAHLDEQWLNPELNQWLVIQSYGHKGGSGQIVHIYPMDKGKEPLSVQEILTYSRIPEEKEQGTDIKGITDLPPIWAITQDIDGKYHLTQVNSENNKISFSNLLALDDLDTYRGIIVKNRDNYLFISPGSRNLLKIIDLEQQPKIILSEDLSKFNVRAIINILPY